MSLDTYLGRRRSIFEETEGHTRLLHPSESADDGRGDAEQLRRIGEPAFHAITVPVLVDPAEGAEGNRRGAG